MGERVGQIAKAPEVKQSNSNSRVRRTERLQSMDTPANRILFLQRTVGNQAVSRLMKSGALQAKLRIGQPRDVYEQEADRVADAVMRMPEPGVQRQVEPEEEEEETLQSKPLVNQITSLVQVQRQEEPEEEEEMLQAKPLAEEITPLVQRQVEPEEEEEELQAKATSDRFSEVTPNLESHIQSLKGGGKPLPESERAYFESRFGRDFSQIRVYTDSRATEIARPINARAFTTGKNVFFNNGQYSPGTSTGRRLLAHELTHVIQQRKGIHNDNVVLRSSDREAQSTKTRSGTAKDYRPLAYLFYHSYLRGLWSLLQQKIQEHRYYLLALSCLSKAAGRGGDTLKVAQFCKKYELVATMPVVGLISRVLKRAPTLYAVNWGIKLIKAMLPLLTKIRMRTAQFHVFDPSIVPIGNESDVGIILRNAKSPKAVIQAAKKKGKEVTRLVKMIKHYSARLIRIKKYILTP